MHQMLPQRIARAAALRNAVSASHRLPIIQRRAFIPSSYTDEKTVNEKFPDGPARLNPAQDPDMVSHQTSALATRNPY